MRTRHHSSSSPVPSPFDEAQGKFSDSARDKFRHQPVLLHEVVYALDIKKDDVVVDATLGGAGHAETLVKGLGGNGLFIGFDADPAAIERARTRLKGSHAKTRLICGNFRNIQSELEVLGVNSITKTLFDLGWSSYQLDSGRGFSFRADEPLLMAYGEGSALTAAVIVNTWGEQTLADVFYGFGGERYSRRIAKAIIERRERKPFTTSRELAETIANAVPISYRRGRIHPATRTFQALRMAVNDELGALEEGLRGAWKLTAPSGRIAVLTFHSVEDRIVKRAFATHVKNGTGRLLSKKPIVPSWEESRENPRARSAKLRVIEKIQKFQNESPNTKDKQIRPFDFSGEA